MSLKAHGNPTREELRDTEVSVPSGMCHCKWLCVLPAVCFADARTPDAVLQTASKQVQKITLKQEVNLSQIALLSLIQGFLPPRWGETALGDTIPSPFSLSGACLAGWWVSGWQGCRHRAQQARVSCAAKSLGARLEVAAIPSNAPWRHWPSAWAQKSHQLQCTTALQTLPRWRARARGKIAGWRPAFGNFHLTYRNAK